MYINERRAIHTLLSLKLSTIQCGHIGSHDAITKRLSRIKCYLSTSEWLIKHEIAHPYTMTVSWWDNTYASFLVYLVLVLVLFVIFSFL